MDSLERIKQFFLSLSDTNMKRWKKLTADFPMTAERFSTRLIELNFSKDKMEHQIIYDSICSGAREMQFRDFVQFIQAETHKISSTYQPAGEGGISRPRFGLPQETRESVLDRLAKVRAQLLDDFLSQDNELRGYVSQRSLIESALKYGAIQSPVEMKSVITKVDPENTGKVNYFNFLYYVTIHLENPQRDLQSEMSLKPTPQKNSFFDGSADHVSDNPSTGVRGKLDPSIFGGEKTNDIQIRKQNRTLDPAIFGGPSPDEEKKPVYARERNLDTSIFVGASPEETGNNPKSGARGTLDASIFGEKEKTITVAPAPVEQIDISKTRDCTDFDQDQTISYIARFVNSKYRSLRDCFGSWRGGSDRLIGDDIWRNIAKEANVELPREVCNQIADEYGGQLTVASFTRLVSEGARINAPEPVRAPPPPLTEVDILLNKIAESLKNKPWEPKIRYSKNAFDLSRNLKQLGLNMKSEELRGIFEEMGMKAIVNEIKERQKPPKKRGH